MTSVWIVGDQLLDPQPAMARARAGGERAEVVMVESARLRVPVEVISNTQFLVDRHAAAPSVPPDRRYPMEPFYRRLRRALGILVDERGLPAGGRWNYDELNRRPLPRGETPPTPGLVPYALTRAVMRDASAAYIDRMSDYCGECRYDRGRRAGPDACPGNTLYWNFLLTHGRRLRANPRPGPAVLGRRRPGAARSRATARARRRSARR